MSLSELSHSRSRALPPAIVARLFMQMCRLPSVRSGSCTLMRTSAVLWRSKAWRIRRSVVLAGTHILSWRDMERVLPSTLIYSVHERFRLLAAATLMLYILFVDLMRPLDTGIIY